MRVVGPGSGDTTFQVGPPETLTTLLIAFDRRSSSGGPTPYGDLDSNGTLSPKKGVSL